MFDIYKCVSFANTANSLMNVDARIVMTIEIGHDSLWHRRYVYAIVYNMMDINVRHKKMNVLRNGLQYIENLSKNI